MKIVSKMKYLFSLLFLFIGYTEIHAQELKENEVPKEVVATLKKMYPNVFVHEWEWKKKKQIYEAEFMMDGSEYEAYFKPDGKWMYTERDIKVQDLPTAVFTSFKNSEYSDWKIDDIEEHQTPEYAILYEIEVKKKEKKKKRKVYLYYLPDGKLVETVIKE